MNHLLLNTIALEPNRWTKEKIPFFKLKQLLQPIKDSNFNFIEVWQYHLSRLDKKDVRQIAKSGRELGLSFPVVGLYLKLHLERKARSQEMDEVKKMLEYANILGAKIIKIFVGNQSAKTISPEDYDRSALFTSEMASLTAKDNLIITGETHQNTLFEDIESCRQFLHVVNADNFKVCYQPLDFRSTQKTIRDYLILQDKIIHLHFQGRKNDEMEFLANSDIDYAKFMQVLSQAKFSGYISIEFVKDCVVQQPGQFDLELVLANAKKDREFVLRLAQECEMEIKT